MPFCFGTGTDTSRAQAGKSRMESGRKKVIWPAFAYSRFCNKPLAGAGETGPAAGQTIIPLRRC